jgi:protein-tyrosine phosphatase
MDSNNLKIIKQLAETLDQSNKVSLILENEDVPDPYYGDESDFKIVFELLNKACEKIKFDLIN